MYLLCTFCARDFFMYESPLMAFILIFAKYID